MEGPMDYSITCDRIHEILVSIPANEADYRELALRYALHAATSIARDKFADAQSELTTCMDTLTKYDEHERGTAP